MHKIITHDGIFHADDVMSVALMKEFAGESILIERKRNISTEEYQDNKVWILDVGGQLDIDRRNFDHHHDKTVMSTCVLLANYLVDIEWMEQAVYNEMIENLMVISEIDCNGPYAHSGFQFNTLIKSFNSLEDGFEAAVDVCRLWIQTCKKSVAEAEESKRIWDEGERLVGAKVCKKFPIHWKRYKEENFLVYPQAGKWNVISADSEKFPLLDHNNVAVFIHANRFIAVFDTKQEALECVFDSGLAILGKQEIEKINKIKSKF